MIASPARPAPHHAASTISIIMLTIILGAPPIHAQVNQAISQKLEISYARYRQALTQQDTANWLKHTSRYRQMWLRNQVVSQGLPWPRTVMDLAIKPPPIAGLKIIDATESGDAARLTYFGRVDFGIPGESAPENALIVWFLKDQGEWRYNTIQYANLNNDPDLKTRAAKGDLTFLSLEEFQIDPKYPVIPKPCEEPYHVARYRVTADGCKATINLNGLSEEIFSHATADRIIIGGLRKGPNKITIAMIPHPGSDPAKSILQVEVLIPSGNPAAPETSVYKWKHTPGKSTFPIEANIWGVSKISVGP